MHPASDGPAKAPSCSLGTALEELVSAECLPPRPVRRIESASELPVRLQHLLCTVGPQATWCAFTDGAQYWFALAFERASRPGESALQFDAYFFCKDGFLWAGGRWSCGRGYVLRLLEAYDWTSSAEEVLFRRRVTVGHWGEKIMQKLWRASAERAQSALRSIISSRRPSRSLPWHSVPLGTFVLVIILAPVGATGSAQASAEFAVSARVLQRTTLQVRSVPPELVISTRDVRQTYVDVGAPTLVEVSNNDPSGYELLVTPKMSGFTAVTVRGTGVEVVLRGEGGAIPERGKVGVRMPLALRYRLQLGPRIEAGRYPWPVQLAVQPLEP